MHAKNTFFYTIPFFFLLFFFAYANVSSAQVICAADVRSCSDGSTVSRTGTNCTFVCPTGTVLLPTDPISFSSSNETFRSCKEILEKYPETKNNDGYYSITYTNTPALTYCDMTTDGGGWTGVTPYIARTFLNGTLTSVQSAELDGFDESSRPFSRYTEHRPSRAAQTYHYTFSTPNAAPISEFYLADYVARANAGSNDKSDLSSIDGKSFFAQTTWDIGYGTNPGVGDISFGSASANGPLTSFGAQQISEQCNSCTINWQNQTRYTFTSATTNFRIGWGEEGLESEGWYPWWSGEIRVREDSTYTPSIVFDITTPLTNTTINNTSITITGEGTTSGNTVNIQSNTGATCTTTITANNQWTCMLSGLTFGTHTLTATEYTDTNIGIATDVITIAVVQNQQTIPVAITNPTFNASVQTLPVVIQGTATPTYSIEIITQNSAHRCTTSAAANGTWSCVLTPTPSIPGTYTFTVFVRNIQNGAVLTSTNGQFVVPGTAPVPEQAPTVISDIGLCPLHITEHMRVGQTANTDEVAKLQSYLNRYEGEALAVSGIYDTATYSAVRRYQKKYARDILMPWGLTEASGYVYKTTLAHINRTLCQATIQCPVFDSYQKQGSTGSEVSKIQRFLQMFGYYGGSISGYFDGATFEAIKAFQEEFRPLVLDPWNLAEPTGYWYKTTRKHANWLQGCFETVEVEGRIF